jgi:hypothetical protein
MADLNQKLYELKHGTFASSEGAWAILSRHLQVVADNVPLSSYFVKHQYRARRPRVPTLDPGGECAFAAAARYALKQGCENTF